MTDNRLKRIREAYAEAESEQPSNYGPLPKWDTLPIQLREAIMSSRRQTAWVPGDDRARSFTECRPQGDR